MPIARSFVSSNACETASELAVKFLISLGMLRAEKEDSRLR